MATNLKHFPNLPLNKPCPAQGEPIVRHPKGVHPLDIPDEARTSVTWWDAMSWTSDAFDHFFPPETT